MSTVRPRIRTKIGRILPKPAGTGQSRQAEASVNFGQKSPGLQQACGDFDRKRPNARCIWPAIGQVGASSAECFPRLAKFGLLAEHLSNHRSGTTTNQGRVHARCAAQPACLKAGRPRGCPDIARKLLPGEIVKQVASSRRLAEHDLPEAKQKKPNVGQIRRSKIGVYQMSTVACTHGPNPTQWCRTIRHARPDLCQLWPAPSPIGLTRTTDDVLRRTTESPNCRAKALSQACPLHNRFRKLLRHPVMFCYFMGWVLTTRTSESKYGKRVCVCVCVVQSCDMFGPRTLYLSPA